MTTSDQPGPDAARDGDVLDQNLHTLLGQAGDPATIVASAIPYLAQVHLEDMRTCEHEHRLPGTGHVDFRGVLSALQTGGYSGPVCFELSRSSHCAPTAVQICRGLWNECFTIKYLSY